VSLFEITSDEKIIEFREAFTREDFWCIACRRTSVMGKVSRRDEARCTFLYAVGVLAERGARPHRGARGLPPPFPSAAEISDLSDSIRPPTGYLLFVIYMVRYASLSR